MEVFIGIDLAWGEKNFSGFSALTPLNNKLKILDIKLLHSLEDIIKEIQNYKAEKIYIGVDAPLLVPNENGNREIEKNFNKDNAKYKISMLPINRKLLTKYSPIIRSELLFQELEKLGFLRDFKNNKVVFEVYPHATIAQCFNKNKILPYKRKKGRDTEFIKIQLKKYQKYLQNISHSHLFFEQNIDELKGQTLKDYEDKLDSFVCAYTLFHSKYKSYKSYKLDGVKTFISPIEES